MAPVAAAGLHPPPGEPVPCHADAGSVSEGGEEAGLQAQALPADDLSRPACPGGCEGGAPPLRRRPGAAPVPVHRHR